MKFGEKLKELRMAKGWSQIELAKKMEVTNRTISSYERGEAYPKKMNAITKIALLFGLSVDNLLNDVEDKANIYIPSNKKQEEFLSLAADQYGARGRKQAEKLVSDLGGMFAGGELSEEDMDAVFQAFTEIYFDSKREAKKYTPKKYRTDESE